MERAGWSNRFSNGNDRTENVPAESAVERTPEKVLHPTSNEDAMATAYSAHVHGAAEKPSKLDAYRSMNALGYIALGLRAVFVRRDQLPAIRHRAARARSRR